MVMSKSELLTALQTEVRIVLHLATKIDRTRLDYRPTPKQRSTIELLRYLSMMGPTLMRYTKTQSREYDIVSARAQVAAFSHSYHTGGKTPIVRCGTEARFDTVAEIDQPGVRVVVNPGGTSWSASARNFALKTASARSRNSCPAAPP